MARIHVTETVSLDGVMQAPGQPEEDTRGGFAHGGWAQGYTDSVMMEAMGAGMAARGAMLLGRRSYEELLRAWTAVTEPNPFTEHLLAARKYVVSRREDLPLAYPNSTLLPGEAAETVPGLKDSVEGDIAVIGSGDLVRSLHAAGLVDHYTLLIHPIVLGSGTPLFGPGERRDLQLEHTVTSTTGVIVARYAVPAARPGAPVGAGAGAGAP